MSWLRARQGCGAAGLSHSLPGGPMPHPAPCSPAGGPIAAQPQGQDPPPRRTLPSEVLGGKALAGHPPLTSILYPEALSPGPNQPGRVSTARAAASHLLGALVAPLGPGPRCGEAGGEAGSALTEKSWKPVRENAPSSSSRSPARSIAPPAAGLRRWVGKERVVKGGQLGCPRPPVRPPVHLPSASSARPPPSPGPPLPSRRSRRRGRAGGRLFLFRPGRSSGRRARGAQAGALTSEQQSGDLAARQGARSRGRAARLSGVPTPRVARPRPWALPAASGRDAAERRSRAALRWGRSRS